MLVDLDRIDGQVTPYRRLKIDLGFISKIILKMEGTQVDLALLPFFG